MRIRAWHLMLTALLIAAPAFASGTEKPEQPTSPTNNNPSGMPGHVNDLTPRQQAEQHYGNAYDDVAKAKEAVAAGKQKNAEKLFKRALSDCRDAVAIDSTYHEAWNLIGFTSRKLGDYPHSLEAYRTALRIKPDFVQAREYYGEALLETKDMKGAKEQLAMLVKLGAKDQAALLQAAIDKVAAAPADSSAASASKGTK
jgi:cytochrome c-type biogenesis protein CcmH/NrfG